ncbi:hypothetical protein DSM19430T_09040 [Desulfovibrio psychrotolerans]|uniref:Uncharacterized protein n=1 Tax=Desulfovibrio psychrotolerans TaxID=415242 RepID=A0A7J0BRB9_9BACT|nr:hypothetical protein DSM19430T_09040 [Desulfovibrio psychrotolerans]
MLFPKSNILGVPRRCTVLPVLQIQVVTRACPVQTGVFALHQRAVNLGYERYVEEYPQPVEHQMGALAQKNAPLLSRAQNGIAHRLLINRLFQKDSSKLAGCPFRVSGLTKIQRNKVYMRPIPHPEVRSMLILTQHRGQQRSILLHKTYGLPQPVRAQGVLHIEAAPDRRFVVFRKRCLTGKP